MTGKHEPSAVMNVDLTDDGTAQPPLPFLPQDDATNELPVPEGLCIFDIFQL